MKEFISLLSGIAAGVLIGFLFAPQSGAETRAKIKALVKEKMPDLSGDRLEQVVDEILKKIGVRDAETEVEVVE